MAQYDQSVPMKAPSPEYEDQAFIGQCRERLEYALKARESQSSDLLRTERLIASLQGALDGADRFDDGPQQSGNVGNTVGAVSYG